MATGSGFNAKQEQLHNQLLIEINDHVDTASSEYAAFKMQITKPLGGAGVLGRCKDLFDIFSNLTKRGNLGILKYEVLKEAFKASNNNDIVKLIEEKEKEIRKACDPEQPTNKATATRQSRAVHLCMECAAAPATHLRVQGSLNFGKGRLGASTSQARLGKIGQTNNKTEGIPVKGEQSALSRPKFTGFEDVDPSDGKFQEEELSYYQTDGKKGYLLILNFSKDRDSTEYDVTGLKEFFEDELKFDVDSPRDQWDDDLTTDEMEVCLKNIRDDLSSNSMSEKYYCFMCAILSHGKQGIIKTKDGQFEIERIRKMFGNKHMETFAGKPKIFFIQACQGSGTQASVETNDEADDDEEEEEEIDESDVLVHIPNDADVLLAYATTPGYQAYRRSGEGSWFIKECISVFRKFKERCHLEEMMVTVRKRVALNWEKKDGGKQMPCTWSTLTKCLRLRQSQC